MTTRRNLLTMAAGMGAASILHPLAAQAEPLGLPLGLQLYSVREQLKVEFAATLMELGRLGYREVEAVGFYDKNPADLRHLMTAAGLRCVSTHFSYADLQPRLTDVVGYAKQFGLEYLICSSPGHKTPGASGNLALEDWRWNAAEFNRMGETCAKAGIRFGYHNHVAEFASVDGVVPYEELLRLTDPAKVTMEMDCGWVVAGGSDPVALMGKHPGRFSLLHVKDFKQSVNGEREAAELGHGTIDYAPIFRAAQATQKIRHIFVEQESFERPYLESLRMDAEYLRRFPTS